MSGREQAKMLGENLVSGPIRGFLPSTLSFCFIKRKLGIHTSSGKQGKVLIFWELPQDSNAHFTTRVFGKDEVSSALLH